MPNAIVKSRLLLFALLMGGGHCLAIGSESTFTPEFATLHRDSSAHRIQLDITGLQKPFLLMATLEQAIGSNDIGLDRAANTEPLLVSFKRSGNKAYLIQHNTGFLASSKDADEAKAARDAFAEAVLWSGDVSQLPKQNGTWIDVSGLLKKDWIGVKERLSMTAQGDYSLDAERSFIELQDAAGFPDNIELAATLTFAGNGQGEFARQAAADARAISIKQRLSLIRLPAGGFKPLPYHPSSGGFSIGHLDFSQPIDKSLQIRTQPRFRLQKTDPNATRSRVIKPIVFYLDRGTPEPIRSALLEGANWWQQGFEAAGFIDAFRVELAPPGLSMSDVRHNTITWTHRATRGWSYGMAASDPRTGEIIKGAVNLGSQRVRQDLLIAEGLLAPYAKDADPALLDEAKAMALHRLKQLAAHEVGHALGFAHNFAASRFGNGSVMDYPHPQIELDAHGHPRLRKAYGTGLGDWDKFLVAYAYGDYPEEHATKMRSDLLQEMQAKGFRYASDPDARQSHLAHECGVLWDLPGDPLDGLAQLMKIRAIALQRFADGALPPDRQAGEAERRVVPIYLLHRYQTEAVARLLGGQDYRYGRLGELPIDSQRAVAGDTQRQALNALRGLLSIEVLRIPDRTQAILVPPPADYSRDLEHFDTRMTPLFDPLQSASAATALVGQLVFQADRLNRIAWQHATNASVPSLQEVFDTLVQQMVAEPVARKNDALLQANRNDELIHHALWVLEGEQLHPAARTQWRDALTQFAKRQAKSKQPGVRDVARLVRNYLANPASVKLRAGARLPPGAPI